MRAAGPPQSAAQSPVAVAEFYEATSDCEAIVNAQCKVELTHPKAWFCDCCAAGRCLAVLGNGYRPRSAICGPIKNGPAGPFCVAGRVNRPDTRHALLDR
jgi:hypothetical protein